MSSTDNAYEHPVWMILPAPGYCGDVAIVIDVVDTPQERDRLLRRGRGHAIAVCVESGWYAAGERLVASDWLTDEKILDEAVWCVRGAIQVGRRPAPKARQHMAPGEIADRMSLINEDEARGWITQKQAAAYRRALTE